MKKHVAAVELQNKGNHGKVLKLVHLLWYIVMCGSLLSFKIGYPFSEFCEVRTVLNFSHTASSFGQSTILRREYINMNLADTEMKAERKLHIIFDFQPTIRHLLTPVVRRKLRNELRSRKEFPSLLH